MKTLLFLLLISVTAFAGSFDIVTNDGRTGHGYYDEQSGTYDIYYSDGQYIHGHINSSGYFRQTDNRGNISTGYYDRSSGNFYFDNGTHGVIDGGGNYRKYDRNSEKVVEHGAIIYR